MNADLRGLIEKWRFQSDPYHQRCADELEAALSVAQGQGFVMVPREDAERALKAVEAVNRAAHNRGRQVCCGWVQGIECCGNPDVEWDTEDEEIMGELVPVENLLNTMLAAAPAQPDGVE